MKSIENNFKKLNQLIENKTQLGKNGQEQLYKLFMKKLSLKKIYRRMQTDNNLENVLSPEDSVQLALTTGKSVKQLPNLPSHLENYISKLVKEGKNKNNSSMSKWFQRHYQLNLNHTKYVPKEMQKKALELVAENKKLRENIHKQYSRIAKEYKKTLVSLKGKLEKQQQKETNVKKLINRLRKIESLGKSILEYSPNP